MWFPHDRTGITGTDMGAYADAWMLVQLTTQLCLLPSHLLPESPPRAPKLLTQGPVSLLTPEKHPGLCDSL